MKVFISWAGEKSKKVAELLDFWIRCVIQEVDPWISSNDIDRGSQWFSAISNMLADVSTGIICLTQENKDRPWILFEAGALAKGLNSSRVMTFLIDLEPKDIKDPLAQFNHTLPTKDGIYKLVVTINNLLQDKKLRQDVLAHSFDTYWPHFENPFKAALEAINDSTPSPKIEDSDILGEILNSVRNVEKRVRSLESDYQVDQGQLSRRIKNQPLKINLADYPPGAFDNLIVWPQKYYSFEWIHLENGKNVSSGSAAYTTSSLQVVEEIREYVKKNIIRQNDAVVAIVNLTEISSERYKTILTIA